MAAQRVSRLQKQMLRWLLADHHRTRGVIASSHEALVKLWEGTRAISAIACTRWEREAGSSWVVHRVVGLNRSISRQQGSKKPQKSAYSCD